jgi:hypothetical protein
LLKSLAFKGSFSLLELVAIALLSCTYLIDEYSSRLIYVKHMQPNQ